MPNDAEATEDCLFDDERHDVYVCLIHRGVIHSDFYPDDGRKPVCENRPTDIVSELRGDLDLTRDAVMASLTRAAADEIERLGKKVAAGLEEIEFERGLASGNGGALLALDHVESAINHA